LPPGKPYFGVIIGVINRCPLATLYLVTAVKQIRIFAYQFSLSRADASVIDKLIVIFIPGRLRRRRH